MLFSWVESGGYIERYNFANLQKDGACELDFILLLLVWGIEWFMILYCNLGVLDPIVWICWGIRVLWWVEADQVDKVYGYVNFT